MRTLLALAPLVALAACNVSTNTANKSVTVQYNSQAAAAASNQIANTAENVATDIRGDVQNTSAKIRNTDVTVGSGNGGNTVENK